MVFSLLINPPPEREGGRETGRERGREGGRTFWRESVLFIGTQFSNLYTAVDTPARGRVGVCVVFVCKYVLGHSRVSQPLNLRLCLLRHLGFLTWPHTLGGRRKAKTKTAGKVTERA